MTRLRMVAHGIGALRGSQNRHLRAVEFIRLALQGFDADHLAYLARRRIPLVQLTPGPLAGAATTWLLPLADLSFLKPEEWAAAALEARPDCREVIDSEDGRAWLATLISG